MIVRMPDGTNVSFPDDMPKEQIKSLIASKFPDEVKEASRPSTASIVRDVYEATPMGMPQRIGRTIADFIVDKGPGIVSGMIDSGKKAVTLGDRVMKGDVRMTDDAGRTSPELIEEAFNAASWALPTSPASAISKAVPKVAEKVVERPALTEGHKAAQAASRINVDLPRAVTSDSVSTQNIGKKLSQTALIGTPIRNAYKKAAEQTDEAAQRIQNDLGTGNIQVAGSRLKQDLAKFATEDEPKAITDLYTRVKQMVDPNVRVQMSETAKVASEIFNARAKAKASESRAVKHLMPALMDRSGRSYEELLLLREDFRRFKSSKQIMDSLGLDERHVNSLYNALSSDLRASAKAAGGDRGLRAFNEANNRAYLFDRDKKEIKKILGEGSEENTASKLFALAGTTSRANLKGLMLARSKVSKDTWDELSSSVINELTRNPTNAQFTPEKFVTKWNKLSDSGKRILFRPEQRQALEDIAAVSSRLKQMNEFANPSGTASAVNLGIPTAAVTIGSFVNPITLVGGAVLAAGGRGASEFLARPNSAKALAEYAKAYEVAAKHPGRVTEQALANKAQTLALIAANGNKEAAAKLSAVISAVKKTAAGDSEVEGLGSPEREPERWQPDQQFQEKYLQGEAL